MKRFLLLLAALLPCAAAAALNEEVPYVQTPENVAATMLQVAGVGPEDYLIDLGSGDGRIVIMAARRFGARGLGVEIDPRLVEQSRVNARAAGVAGRALFREQDLFKTDLTPASVVTMYLLPEVNLQLRSKLLKLRPGTRIVSHDWDMGDWQPDKTVVVDTPNKPIGREKISRVHLWIVPARVEGTWCGTGKHKGATLRIGQEFQRFAAEIGSAETFKFEGRIHGAMAGSPKHMNFYVEGDKLRAQAINKKYSPWHRALFARPRGGACH